MIDTGVIEPPSGRGGREAVRWRKFVGDPTAVRDAARSTRVVLGSRTAADLRKFGVGVPPLWPAELTSNLRRAPLDIRTFQILTGPPGSCLWVAANDDARIVASQHIEFVGDIARVAEAREIGPDGVGATYVLSVEPVDLAISRCLDTAGCRDDPAAPALSARLRGWYPFSWHEGVPEAAPAEQRRSLGIRFEPVAGSTPAVTQQDRNAVDDVPSVSDRPTREELRSVLDAFFAPAGR